MFFQPKLIAGCIIGAGIGIPSYIYSGGGCSVSYIIIPGNGNLGSNDSTLDCQDTSKSRNYSVYLVFQDDNEINSSKFATLKVVDNNAKKVMWGPGADSKDAGDLGGIESSYEDAQGKITTEIRVPLKKIGHQGKIRISCQKSMVQIKKGLKTKTEGGQEQDCKASLLRSTNMNFELIKADGCKQGGFGKKTCDINLSDKFEGYLGFQPKAVLCNS